MEWATHFVSEVYNYLNHRDDTSIDRLNRLYTVTFLSAFVTLITSQQYVVGGRIICWMPREFTDSHIIYAHDMCWFGHTNYYVSENFTTLTDPSTPRTYPFSIYPWLPIILIGMAASFTAPYLLIWRGFSTRSGIDIKRMIELENREDLPRVIHYILFKKYSSKHSGRFYVMTVYLVMKFFYIINLFCQIILTTKLLTGHYFHINMKQILKILSVHYNMWSSAHFPIETMCDFMVRMLGQNNNWYTLQCILPFNLFTKRIFALLIIWFSILFILNLFDLIVTWLCQRIWFHSNRYNYIMHFFHLYEKYLHIQSKGQVVMLDTKNQRFRQEFVYKYLGLDGYLLLKFLHTNTTDLEMSRLIGELFKQFSEIKPRRYEKISRKDENIIL